MKIYFIRYYDKFGLRREKEINAADYQAALERFKQIIPESDVYEVVV